MPVIPSLNADLAGQIMPNLVITGLGTQGKDTMLDQAGGHLVADVAGWFTT